MPMLTRVLTRDGLNWAASLCIDRLAAHSLHYFAPFVIGQALQEQSSRSH